MNDDTLILYYYRDGLTDDERRDVQAALDADARLRTRYDALCADLALATAPSPTAPPADLTARWHDSIDRAVRLERQRAAPPGRLLHLPSFAWGGAVAAALVAGIGIGVFLRGGPDAVTPAVDAPVYAATADPPGASLAFARGLKVHLSESRDGLENLRLDAGAERSLLLMRMIEQNRLFERAAAQNDAKDLARVLRAFEPILLRLAADDITPEEADALQAQLAFELKVMLTKLGRRVSDEPGPI